MKKFIATVVSIAIVLSLAACKKKQPEPTVTGSGTTTESQNPDGSSAASSTFPNLASQYVTDVREKYKSLEGEDCEYHVPELLVKSAYADSINQEIAKIFEKYKEEKNKNGECSHYSTEYIAYLTKEGILSLVFIECDDNDLNEFHVYNLDVNSGEKVENTRLAEIAGISDIRKTAMDALQTFYNRLEIFKVENYKVVKESGEALDEQEKAVEQSFGEKYLNQNMMLGLTNEGKMFFVSPVCTTAGAEIYYFIYDVDGIDLDDEDNPAFVGPRDDGTDDEAEDDTDTGANDEPASDGPDDDDDEEED